MGCSSTPSPCTGGPRSGCSHRTTSPRPNTRASSASRSSPTWSGRASDSASTMRRIGWSSATRRPSRAEIEVAALPPLDGARELIEASRARGLRVAVGSQSIAAWVKATLRSAALDGLFDAVVSGDEVERGKPRAGRVSAGGRAARGRARALRRDRGLACGPAVGGRGRDARRAVAAGLEHRGAAAARAARRRLAPRGRPRAVVMPSSMLPTVAGPSLTLPTVAGPSLTLPTVAGGCSHVGRLVSLPAPRVHARLG